MKCGICLKINQGRGVNIYECYEYLGHNLESVENG